MLENSNSSNKENIDVAALMSSVAGDYQAFLQRVRVELIKDKENLALIRRVYNKLKEFNPSSCIAEQSRKKPRAINNGAEVFRNH